MARDPKLEKKIAQYRKDQYLDQDPEADICDWDDLTDAAKQVWRARYRTGWSLKDI